MSQYQGTQTLRQNAIKYTLHKREWLKQKLNLHLPDSWFVLALTLTLAFASWWLQQFVAKLPLWQQVTQRQVSLTIDEAVFIGYRNGILQGQVIAKKASLQSLQAPEGGSNKEADSFEHWQMDDFELWLKKDSQILFIKAPFAALANESRIFKLEGGVEALGFKSTDLEKMINNSKSLSNKKELKTFAQLKPLAFLSLSSPTAVYQESDGLLKLAEEVRVTLNNHVLLGNTMNIDLNKAKMTLNNVHGEFLP